MMYHLRAGSSKDIIIILLEIRLGSPQLSSILTESYHGFLFLHNQKKATE